MELSRSQYNERNGAYAENTYRRAERRLGTTADYDGSAQGGPTGDSDGHRNARGNATVFGQTIREKLPDVAGRSARGTLGYDRGVELTGTEYTDEAAEESGASFITFSNDYAAVRNHMKESDVGEDAGAPIKFFLPDTEGRQLSKEQQDCFKDSTVRGKPVI